MVGMASIERKKYAGEEYEINTSEPEKLVIKQMFSFLKKPHKMRLFPCLTSHSICI